MLTDLQWITDHEDRIKKKADTPENRAILAELAEMRRQFQAFSHSQVAKVALYSYRIAGVDQTYCPEDQVGVLLKEALSSFYQKKFPGTHKSEVSFIEKSYSKEGEKVRFTAPGREHDVLYTMSSGQLSAVLLAFSLSLNQIYARSGFQTLLIDDPIQCMDDINMVSLVELLGREFGQTQVIISTHEDDFARFISYKYGKYGLKHKSVSLKRG